jgi:hypothetical protein
MSWASWAFLSAFAHGHIGQTNVTAVLTQGAVEPVGLAQFENVRTPTHDASRSKNCGVQRPGKAEVVVKSPGPKVEIGKEATLFVSQRL